jgi:hypothetical protein
MRRGWIWLPLIIGWLPMWALYAVLMSSAHGVSLVSAGIISARAIAVAAALGLLVQRLTTRLPWPHPFRPSFLAMHFAAAVVYAVAWQGLAAAFEALVHLHLGGHTFARFQFVGFLVTGIWMYVMVAGVAYAAGATERAARAEALVARSQLAALRAQLDPHFLFNALHTLVQLIPREPARAAQATEQIAALLRTTIEEDRDLVSLAEERAFVERYLDLERLRFGERLLVRIVVSEAAGAALLPAFALQTLVENAVRHGAAPRVEPTTITIEGGLAEGVLTVTVRDTGAGASEQQLGAGGTGLRRLRERLAALYGDRARLDLAGGAGRGFTATLVVPP